MKSNIFSFFHFFVRHAPYMATAWMVIFFFAAPVSAHKVTVFAWVEGDTIFTESKFGGGRKAKNAAIEVYDTDGNKLLDGKTDENGAFSFRIPRKTGLKVVLIAGMGHRGEWIIPLEEVAPDASQVPPSETPPKVESSETGESTPPAVQSGPSVEEIQSAVEKALDKKLKPLIKLMAESREKGPTVSDIFAGIGYIAGLVGVAAYVQNRKKKEK